MLGSYRSIWSGPEVEASPALHFLAPRQRVELAPADAAQLGVLHGQEVIVSDEHGQLRARVAVRDSAPIGTAFLERDLDSDGVNLLKGTEEITFQVGANDGDTISVATTSMSSLVGTISLGTGTTLSTIDSYINAVSGQAAELLSETELTRA